MYQQPSGQNTGGSPGSSRISEAAGLLSLTLITALALVVLWEMVPQSRKKMWTARLYRSCHQVMTAIARRTAAQSMANELATGRENYEVPLWFAVRADQFERKARQAAADV